MANSREEQLRSNRRLARQLIGAVALALAVIGLVTVLGWCVAGLRTALDDSDRKERYADRIYGLVMFDVPGFADTTALDSSVFRQAAIWGSLYVIQKNNGSLEGYERDADTGSVILPQLEVDTYLTNLLGPDYSVTDGNFETEEFVYHYDEDKQGYLVPVTGSVGLYTPKVEKISTSGGKTYVTVGYIPTINNNANGELSLTAPTEPTKYMDFVFTRGENRQWYLSALQESEMQPAATPTPAPTVLTESTDPQTMVENNLDSSMTDAASGSADSTPVEPTPEGQDQPAPDEEDTTAPDSAADGDAASSDAPAE